MERVGWKHRSEDTSETKGDDDRRTETSQGENKMPVALQEQLGVVRAMDFEHVRSR
jgi:hypothetical protein